MAGACCQTGDGSAWSVYWDAESCCEGLEGGGELHFGVLLVRNSKGVGRVKVRGRGLL